MIYFQGPLPLQVNADGPVSPLNALWLGKVQTSVSLPQFGHLLLLFPLGETAVSLAKINIPTGHYLWISSQTMPPPWQLEISFPRNEEEALLILWLSPPFIAEIASFLQIAPEFDLLLQGMPLLQGDRLSTLLADIAAVCRTTGALHLLSEYFLEVAGEFLQLLRMRQMALRQLAMHKENTISDLFPRLLRARQFVAASYANSFTNADVAAAVGLSEYHFARLFKQAFDVSVRQMVIRLRLDAARRLLAEADTAVTEIAFDVGYQSLSAFINAFHRAYGCSPGRYRRLFLGERKDGR